MAKQLPEDWINGKKTTLNVSADLGIKGSYPSNLVVLKQKGHKKLSCRWKPFEDEDPRANKGRNKSGVRAYFYRRTGCEDPIDAGNAAIKWVKQKQLELQEISDKNKFNSRHSLNHYWEIWWGRYSQQQDKSDRNKMDTKNRWDSLGYGIGQQQWSRKSIDEISQKDIADYFAVIDARGDEIKGSMAETKKNQKSLLNKLNREALNDFPDLRQFVFPKISSKQEIEKEHFKEEEWKKLLEKINELSGGVAKKDISQDQYENLLWTERNKCNQRNWVDLYDVCLLMFYFFLRSEDVPRLQMEWFSDVGLDENGSPKVVLYLEKTKRDRLKQETEHIFPSGYTIWKRIKKRRPSGYISFPYLPREYGKENDCHFSETANVLLKKASELCSIKKRNAITRTTLRHTAFRLRFEQMPQLRDEQEIRLFADNGNTGVESLRKHYLRYEQKSSFIENVRKDMPRQSWALINRVSMKDE